MFQSLFADRAYTLHCVSQCFVKRWNTNFLDAYNTVNKWLKIQWWLTSLNESHNRKNIKSSDDLSHLHPMEMFNDQSHSNIMCWRTSWYPPRPEQQNYFYCYGNYQDALPQQRPWYFWSSLAYEVSIDAMSVQWKICWICFASQVRRKGPPPLPTQLNSKSSKSV